jgi:hypothetical protein
MHGPRAQNCGKQRHTFLLETRVPGDGAIETGTVGTFSRVKLFWTVPQQILQDVNKMCKFAY